MGEETVPERESEGKGSPKTSRHLGGKGLFLSLFLILGDNGGRQHEGREFGHAQIRPLLSSHSSSQEIPSGPCSLAAV